MWAYVQRDVRPRNIGGTLCWKWQSESSINPFPVPRCKVWLLVTARVPFYNVADIQCVPKSDARIQITITTAYLIELNTVMLTRTWPARPRTWASRPRPRTWYTRPRPRTSPSRPNQGLTWQGDNIGAWSICFLYRFISVLWIVCCT